jgi:hypothetical protein
MTTEELVAWGATENAARKADLANIKSETDLQRAKDAAAKRRKAVGLTAGQAAKWVKEAQMKERCR